MENTAKEIVYAGFWLRFIAFILDTIIVGTIAFLINGIFLGGSLTIEAGPPAIGQQIIYFILIIMFWVNWDGQTPGKKLLGLKLVQSDGSSPISYSQAILRYVGYIISAAIICLGFIMVGFTRQKKSLHDILAGTLVVKKLEGDQY